MESDKLTQRRLHVKAWSFMYNHLEILNDTPLPPVRLISYSKSEG